MKKYPIFQLPKNEFLRLAVFFIVSLLILFLVGILAFLNERNNITYQIDKLADNTPQEVHRCSSQRGFSIIKPAGWHTLKTSDSLTDEIFENSYELLSSNGRRPHTIQISRIVFSEKDTDITKTIKDVLKWRNPKMECLIFQDDFAFLFSEKLHTSARSAYGINQESNFCLVFQREEFLYFIRICLIGEFNNVPLGLWKYLNTFNHEAKESGRKTRSGVNDTLVK